MAEERVRVLEQRAKALDEQQEKVTQELKELRDLDLATALRKEHHDKLARKSVEQALEATDFPQMMRVLAEFGSTDKDMAFQGCEAIVGLAADPANRHGLVAACDAIVQILKSFGTTDKVVASQACWAIGNLAAFPENRRELGRIGACDAVAQALKTFGSTESDVALFGCFAISNLALSNLENKRELGRAGACDAVIQALKSFGGTEIEVATRGCRAIRNLACNSPENQRELRLCLGASSAIELSLDNEHKADALKRLLRRK